MTFDISGVRKDRLASKNRMIGLMLKCVQLAGMKILAGPYALDTGALDPNPGLTGWAVLTTSHISIHTFIQQGKAFIDLFSCLEYDARTIRQAVQDFYQPEAIESREVIRAERLMFREEDNIP